MRSGGPAREIAVEVSRKSLLMPGERQVGVIFAHGRRPGSGQVTVWVRQPRPPGAVFQQILERMAGTRRWSSRSRKARFERGWQSRKRNAGWSAGCGLDGFARLGPFSSLHLYGRCRLPSFGVCGVEFTLVPEYETAFPAMPPRHWLVARPFDE